jgi:hypothetical protein
MRRRRDRVWPQIACNSPFEEMIGHHSQPKVELLNEEVAIIVHDDPLRNGRVARENQNGW